MKTIFKSFMMLIFLSVSFISCDSEEYELDPEIVEMGNLETPSNNESISINTENGSNIIFSWSPSKSADGGAISYTIKFDEEGGDFSDPLYTSVSDNGGGATKFTMSPSRLNVIAAQAGIPQLETGNIIWTVEATSSYFVESFPVSSTVSLTRPEGLAIFPEFMYIYGSATEASSINNAVAFKEISNQLPSDNIEPGVFESITKLTPGEFYIVNGRDENSEDFTSYYVNDEGKIRA